MFAFITFGEFYALIYLYGLCQDVRIAKQGQNNKMKNRNESSMIFTQGTTYYSSQEICNFEKNAAKFSFQILHAIKQSERKILDVVCYNQSVKPSHLLHCVPPAYILSYDIALAKADPGYRLTPILGHH